MIKFINKKLAFVSFIFAAFLFPYFAYAESFTLCDGFSYEDVAKNVNLGVNFEGNKYVKSEDLRLLNIKYIGFDKEVHEGKLIAAYEVANPTTGEIINISKEILEIFEELFEKKYPINEMSCFYYRNIAGTDRLSWHAFGLAIDINYTQNPCIIVDENGKMLKTIPGNFEKYADRTLEEEGMIKIDDDCYNAFVNRGWEWGGSWHTPIDYMHFQRFSWKTPRPTEKY